MVTWLLAFAIGLGAAWKAWSVVGITETHYLVALGMTNTPGSMVNAWERASLMASA